MGIDHDRIYTRDERARTRSRRPECSAPLALTWRRARQPGRSEDLHIFKKTACPDRCVDQPAGI